MCDKNAAHAEALQSVFNPMNLIPLPDGMTLTELDARLEKWIGFHNPTQLSWERAYTLCRYLETSLDRELTFFT